MSIIEKAIEKIGVEDTGQTHPKKDPHLNKRLSTEGNTLAVKIKPENGYQKEPGDSRSTNKRAIENREKKAKIFSIDRKKIASQGYLSTKNTNARLFEEYRIIKRPLVNNAMEGEKKGIKRANLILVTSSQPEEGKTFTAINLALSIANERDKKVLLIDADVAKPSISRELGLKESRHGLIDYLDGKEPDFSRMMIKTNISGLSIIPAGKKHSYSTELLASDRMAELAEELHSRYPDRIVIFDSPPLLAATQAEVLAGHVGQVVLVIEAENTVQRMVVEAMDKLKECDIVMGVLNKSIHSFKLDYGYGQYGHYGH